MTTLKLSDIEAYFLHKVCLKISQKQKDFKSMNYKMICDALNELSMTILYNIENEISFDDDVNISGFLDAVFNPDDLPF